MSIENEATYESLLLLPIDIFRLRLLIRPKKTSRLAPHHAALFYAMLCDAHGIAQSIPPVIPDGLRLAAPDQGVIYASADRPLSMGLTFLIEKGGNSETRLNQMIAGLRSLGRNPKSNGQSIREFTVDRIEDLEANTVVQAAGQAIPVSLAKLKRQFELLQSLDSVRLRFTMPLRCSRPKAQRLEGHGFFDEDYFPAGTFLARLIRRLQDLGWQGVNDTKLNLGQPSTKANELVWLDVGYGSKGHGRRDGKTLGGVVGSCVLNGLSELSKIALVLGQYIHVGENTRFGFGCYQIEELGNIAPSCPRTSSILDYAFKENLIDQLSSDLGLESGVLTRCVSAAINGEYFPDPPYQVHIEKKSGGVRTLSIPSIRDRAMQRLVMDAIAEPIDSFLESSAMAYRRGLGRDQAARRVQTYFRQGYLWAVKADFESFFDNVDQGLLQRRLNAYFSDPPLVAFLMQAIQAHDLDSMGIPTGSPLSPVIANLFLDRFDEKIAAVGGKLVRYADDFMILCRTQSEAEALYEETRQQAEHLALRLNQDKSSLIRLSSGFEFLGFQFSCQDQWIAGPGMQPQLIEDLGWVTSKPKSKLSSDEKKPGLPGESDLDNSFRNQILVAGPSVKRISVQGKKLVLENDGTPGIHRVPLIQVRELDIIGDATIDWISLSELAEQGTIVRVVDSSIRTKMEVLSEPKPADARGVMAQATLNQAPERQLGYARWLIASKIHNYAILGERYWSVSHGRVRQSFELVKAALNAQSMEQLLGFEGQAAALWYGSLQEMLGRDFRFIGRVAPDASDPINVLLNFAQTLLHRLTGRAIVAAGLVPTLGTLHRERPGHATLASDLQEPFRHLMDRVVIDASKVLRATDFVPDADGPFSLKIQPRARTEFVAMVHRMLAKSVTGYGQSEPTSYGHQIRNVARQFRVSILDSSVNFRSFWHPSVITEQIWKSDFSKPS